MPVVGCPWDARTRRQRGPMSLPHSVRLDTIGVRSVRIAAGTIPRREKTRLARAGFSELSRLWHRTELLHHAEHVHLDPALHDLALDHTVDRMTYELDALAGRGYSLELA